MNQAFIGDIVEHSPTQIAVSNITTTEIRNVLGETSNEVSKLCTSSKINPYSSFGPAQVLTYGSVTYKRPTSLGNFAAYNHWALKPTNYGGGADTPSSPVKTYENQTYYYGTSVVLIQGERVPTWQNTDKSWENIAVKFTIDGVSQWAKLNVTPDTSQNRVSVKWHTNNTDAETKTVFIEAFYTYNVTSSTTGAVLTGVRDEFNRELYGVPIEEEGFSRVLNIQEPVTIEFDATMNYVTTHQVIQLSMTPTHHDYTFYAWETTDGVIQSQSSDQAGYTTSCDISGDGTYKIHVEAIRSGYAPAYKTFSVRVLNNQATLLKELEV